MTHLDIELNNLRNEIINMWNLVISQLAKTQDALEQFDKDLAREIIQNEKRVNAMELKIDRDCENLIALFNPVAVDLRFVLAVLKINSNLERTGDIAEGIAKYIVAIEKPFEKDLLKETMVLKMFAEVNSMLEDILQAFSSEDSKLVRTIFKRDEQVDDINKSAIVILTDYIKNHPDQIEACLYILSTIRKLERIGDQAKNLAEELIFFVEAKVLKHMKKKHKQE